MQTANRTTKTLLTLSLLGATTILFLPPVHALPVFPHAPHAPGMDKEDKKNKGKIEEAPTPYTGPKKRLAIMNKDLQGNTAPVGDWTKLLKTKYGIENGDDVGLKLNSMLTTALQNTGRFVLVERQNFEDIRVEQDLTTEGQTTEQTGAKKEIGRASCRERVCSTV